MELTIRPVETMAEYRAVEAIQRQAWAMDDDLEVVPVHLLLTAAKNGGMVLGAFAGNEMVGFVFGFPGITAEGKVKHCSHMMGVAPGVQSSGVGYRLKLAQRAFALAQDLDLVTWTYDPLESRNAYLNVHKLGAVCRTYIRDLYGALDDGLNAGLPSDRFEVEWWLEGETVQRRLASSPLPRGRGEGRGGPWLVAHVPRETSGGFLAPGPLTLDADAPYVQVEIPAEYQAIRAADRGLALAWRLATRELFEAYFAAGYTAVDFLSRRAEGARRSFYLLSRDEP